MRSSPTSSASTAPKRSCTPNAWPAATRRRRSNATLVRVERVVAERLAAADETGGFLEEIARRWHDVDDNERVRGVTGDVVLLHIATMTNLFAALGWTLCLVLLDPDVRGRVEARAGSVDRGYLDRCALEAVRIGQRSIMLRSVLKPCELDDGATTYRVEPGVLLATMLPLTNTSALPGLDRFDPDRWSGRRLRDGEALEAKEEVTTFGHGSHRCPAQRFSLSAIGRAVERLFSTFELRPGFAAVRAVPSQIGGVARSADPCPVDYVRRRAATLQPEPVWKRGD